jgi:DNA repair exonuclease SbcCD nuclease subunit
MSSFRFIHCSDLHIDSPFKGVQSLQPDLARKLRASTQQAFKKIVQLAIREQVDAVLIAGDIYDSADKSLRAQMKFRDALNELCKANIPAFMVHGNHDPLDSWSSSLAWPENVTVFSGDTVECFPVEKNGLVLARVYGISYPVRNVQENLALRFERKHKEGFAVGLLHANVGGNKNHDAYAPCSKDDLITSGMDYWALGHIHAHEILNPAQPAIVYSGNTQARHFNEAEAKGCCLVTLKEQGVPEIQFRATDAVRFRSESVNLTSAMTMDEVLHSLKEKIEGLSLESEGRDLVLRLTLIGRTEMHQELRRTGAVEDLMKEIQEDYGNRTPWVWVELALETRGTYDIDELRQGQDFIADLIGLYDNIENGKREVDLDDVLKSLYGNSSVRKYLDEISELDFKDLLEQAKTITLDRLVEPNS